MAGPGRRGLPQLHGEQNCVSSFGCTPLCCAPSQRGSQQYPFSHHVRIANSCVPPTCCPTFLPTSTPPPPPRFFFRATSSATPSGWISLARATVRGWGRCLSAGAAVRVGRMSAGPPLQSGGRLFGRHMVVEAAAGSASGALLRPWWCCWQDMQARPTVPHSRACTLCLPFHLGHVASPLGGIHAPAAPSLWHPPVRLCLGVQAGATSTAGGSGAWSTPTTCATSERGPQHPPTLPASLPAAPAHPTRLPSCPLPANGSRQQQQRHDGTRGRRNAAYRPMHLARLPHPPPAPAACRLPAGSLTPGTPPAWRWTTVTPTSPPPGSGPQ